MKELIKIIIGFYNVNMGNYAKTALKLSKIDDLKIQVLTYLDK